MSSEAAVKVGFHEGCQRLCKELGIPSSRKPSLTALGSLTLILFTLGCSSLVTDLSPSLPCEVRASHNCVSSTTQHKPGYTAGAQ